MPCLKSHNLEVLKPRVPRHKARLATTGPFMGSCVVLAMPPALAMGCRSDTEAAAWLLWGSGYAGVYASVFPPGKWGDGAHS